MRRVGRRPQLRPVRAHFEHGARGNEVHDVEHGARRKLLGDDARGYRRGRASAWRGCARRAAFAQTSFEWCR